MSTYSYELGQWQVTRQWEAHSGMMCSAVAWSHNIIASAANEYANNRKPSMIRLWDAKDGVS